MIDPRTGAVTGAPPEGSAGGLPQFDPSQWPGQIVWVLVIFFTHLLGGLLYFFVGRRGSRARQA